MNRITLETHVAEIVNAVPQTADAFRTLGIDFCCGGRIPLEEAARERGIDPSYVLSQVLYIEQKHQDYAHNHPAAERSEAELIAHIQEKHHAFLREELPALTPYVTKVSKVHGDHHPHLLRVKEIFSSLKSELLDHTADEDANVFPLILQFALNPAPETAAALKPHIEELETEHSAAGDLLKELREITGGFEPPAGACGTYRLVYQRLAALEKDTFEHIHLENNVLFEKVREAAGTFS